MIRAALRDVVARCLAGELTDSEGWHALRRRGVLIDRTDWYHLIQSIRNNRKDIARG